MNSFIWGFFEEYHLFDFDAGHKRRLRAFRINILSRFLIVLFRISVRIVFYRLIILCKVLTRIKFTRTNSLQLLSYEVILIKLFRINILSEFLRIIVLFRIIWLIIYYKIELKWKLSKEINIKDDRESWKTLR